MSETTTIKVPSGVARFYRDYAKFVGVPFDTVMRSEIGKVARSLLDTLRELPQFSVKNATKRYGLEV